MQSSVREIRTRLLVLLVRAFVLVLFLSLFFFLIIISYFLTSTSSNFSPPLSPFYGTIQGYYIGHGNWDGVESAFEANSELRFLNTILLDTEQRVMLDRRTGSVLPVGSIYEIQPSDFAVPLKIQGKFIGILVISPLSWSARLSLVRGFLLPASAISFMLAFFLVVVSILLVRRYINPLADVIYAARAVADGKLDTRIPNEGPQDLRSLSKSFNEMASSLERNDRERRDMLADIAHELRTPLSVIRGRLEGIVDGVYPENGEPVSIALEQTYLMQRLVDDLRLLTLAESRQLHFESKPVNIGNLAQHVIDLFQAEAREKYISLSLNCPVENPNVQADAQRTEQVIANLVNNALRYVPENSKVWIDISSDEKSVILSVKDNGAGVPEADLPFIFDRFWRKDKSRSRSSGGTGLGLAIAKQLVEAQGGQIVARNLSAGGLQVEIVFKKAVT